MRITKLLSAVSVTVALATTGLLAQDEPVQVRVRAIAGPDGKVEVVEEQIIGAEKASTKKVTEPDSPKKEADKEEPGEPLRAKIIRRLQAVGEKNAADPASGDLFEIPLGQGEWGPMPHSEYWIGVQIGPVAPEIRKHLAVKHGILIVHVYPDSPAAKAELQADDILIQAGELKIETGVDLVKAVDGAKTKELSFRLLREGKEKTLSVTPIKRADAAEVELRTTKTAPASRMERLQAAQRQFEKALEALRAANEEKAEVDFLMVRPGAFVFGAPDAKLPDDLTIQVTKEGNKPAKIMVKKGDQKWDVTADKLEALPKEIRVHVEQMLHHDHAAFVPNPHLGAHSGVFQMKVPHPTPLAPAIALPGIPGIPATPAIAPLPPKVATAWSTTALHSAADAKLDQILKKLDSLASPELDAMKKELQTLRKEVDELRKKSSGSEASR